MRVLLIAYEYPPIVAAQALRWFYLANGLAERGVEVHVVCPDMPDLPAYPVSNHPGVIEHRVWPGPFIGSGQWFAGRLRASPAQAAPRVEQGALPPPFLSQAYCKLRAFLDQVLYPDVRSEWFPFARTRMIRMLAEQAFDAIISSHEPGVDLLLGLWAKRRYRLPWIVDLADPLCAPYSPKWRGWIDRRVEAHVIARADRVIVTTEHLRGLLMQRHGLRAPEKFACIPQGAPVVSIATEPMASPVNVLHLVYTGNFYAGFRNPSNLAEALRRLASTELSLTIAGDNASFSPMFKGLENVRFLGKMGHFECLSMQRQADVLLNIGNAQSYQIPGKIYEYLAAGKTILHIRTGPDDPSEALLDETGIGRLVDNTPEAILDCLRELLQQWRTGTLASIAPSAEALQAHSWAARADGLLGVIHAACAR